MTALQERRSEFLEYTGSPDVDLPWRKDQHWSYVRGPFLELPKLEREKLGLLACELDEGNIQAALSGMVSRIDCCDFAETALMRMLYRYPNSSMLTPKLREEIKKTALQHIYWVDEPGEEHMCFCTENHQIIHHSNELLAGQLWPDEVFTNNGKTGDWHIHHAEGMIRRWLDWRIRFGFSEWNSNCYYDEDLLGLFNLADYADDPDIRSAAKSVIDLLLFHVALNSYKGLMGCTHGRTYARNIVNTARDGVRSLVWLGWGVGDYRYLMNMSAIVLTCSDYQLPEVIANIANDLPKEAIIKERHSLDVEQARLFDVYPERMEDLAFFWGAQVFCHRQVIENSLKWADKGRDGLNARIWAYWDHHEECDRLGIQSEQDPDDTAMTRVNIYTYKTPDYMLSCAQDYRKGKTGFQQHIWQATLGDGAAVFSTQPGAQDVGTSRPDYWHGNARLPRAAAYRNVLIALYRFEPEISRKWMWYTHAFFPQQNFDEFVEKNGWYIGRKGNGYVALTSLMPTEWAPPREDVGELMKPDGAAGENWKVEKHEIIAQGAKNAWICEMGNAESNGTFEQFVETVSSRRPAGDPLRMTYDSPSVGSIEFGWSLPFLVDGQEIALGDYPLFDNPYCQAPFDSRKFELSLGDERYTIEPPTLV